MLVKKFWFDCKLKYVKYLNDRWIYGNILRKKKKLLHETKVAF